MTEPTALAIKNENGRAVVGPTWSPDQVALIKRTVALGTTDDELQLFLHVAQRSGLDPFAKQIYCIVRGQGDWRKATIQTGIDGYRLIAERTNVCAGIDDPIFVGTEKQPTSATVTVWRLVQGQRCPFTATARWSEYKPAPPSDTMWNRMPFSQLGKCAESLALRKAFPADMSAIYTDDEMDQAPPPIAGEIIEHPVSEQRSILDPLPSAKEHEAYSRGLVRARELGIDTGPFAVDETTSRTDLIAKGRVLKTAIDKAADALIMSAANDDADPGEQMRAEYQAMAGDNKRVELQDSLAALLRRADFLGIDQAGYVAGGGESTGEITALISRLRAKIAETESQSPALPL